MSSFFQTARRCIIGGGFSAKNQLHTTNLTALKKMFLTLFCSRCCIESDLLRGRCLADFSLKAFSLETVASVCKFEAVMRPGEAVARP